MQAGPWQHEFDVAVAAVREAALLAREIRDRFDQRALKADRSPVTVADFAVQALVAERLRRGFPDDPLVAEEDSAALHDPRSRSIRQAVLEAVLQQVPGLSADSLLDTIDRGRGVPGPRFWTLDPVDGTQGFIRGDQYVVALALIVGGRVEIGLLGCPALPLPELPGDAVGWIACAVRDHGAFRQSLTANEHVPLRVSACRLPCDARVLRSFEAEHIDLPAFNRVVDALHVDAPPQLVDSQAKHALIAAGQAELLIRIPASPEYCDKIWDQAAGTLIVEEAGGRVTDLRGVPLDFGTGRLLIRNEGVIASNGQFHDAVVEAWRRFGKSDEPTSETRQRGATMAREQQSGARTIPVEVPIGDQSLPGDLGIPSNPHGIVLFAHGSGSSRHSPRNQYVARALERRHLATLLIDLLTPQEEVIDDRTAEYRFDIEMLADRLVTIIDWLKQRKETTALPIGLFGASTGGGAALMAAAQRTRDVAAVVSRGGRPDLAGAALAKVATPTLLIVGGFDTEVIEMNRDALAQMKAEVKLEIVPGATHLFEEPGTLEQVADLAGNWFAHHLQPAMSSAKGR